MQNPHTIGDVISHVIDLSRPKNADDIRLGRMHDGMTINLATRMMDSMRHKEITKEVMLHIRSIVGRYQSHNGIDLESTLVFLDNVRTAPSQPGMIGAIGGMMVRRMQSVLSSLKMTKNSRPRHVAHASESHSQAAQQGDATGEAV